MNNKEQFVILKAFEKVVKDALKDVGADVKADLMEMNDGEGVSLNVTIGNQKVKLALVCPTSTDFAGVGPEFEEFMRSHGMVREVIDDGWKKCVVEAGGNVLWEETGEIVPGAYVQTVNRSAYPKATMHAEDVLFAARDAGMLEAATMPMLGGGYEAE